MTLQDFKDIHTDDSPIRKLDLLIETMEFWRTDSISKTDAKWRHNDEEVEYWRNEESCMSDRALWLYEELAKVLDSKED